jgi:TPR repeat protein
VLIMTCLVKSRSCSSKLNDGQNFDELAEALDAPRIRPMSANGGRVQDVANRMIGDRTGEDLYEMGRDCELGRNGVARCSAQAIDLFQMAADKQYPKAMRRLGRLSFAAGKTSSRFYKTAVDLFTSAAALGDAGSMYCLGQMHMHGYGIDQNQKEAYRLVNEAAVKGNKYAMLDVGIRCFQGNGMRVDKNQALAWFRAAEKAGNRDATQWIRKVLS